MSNVVKEILDSMRPRNLSGRGDKYLKEIGQELRRLLLKAQQRELPERYRLGEPHLSRMAALLTEFAEDLHNDSGLWRAVEDHQRKLFGTPLPFLVAPGEEPKLSRFDERRVRYFVWGVWRQLHPFTAIRLDDPTIALLAQTAAPFLAERIERIPRDSGVAKLLLARPEDFFACKQVLGWVGGGSYLFSSVFFQALAQSKNTPHEMLLEEFTLLYFSVWSGLTAAEVYAATAPLTDDEREAIRDWINRRVEVFEVIERTDRENICESIKVLNLMSGEEFMITVNAADYALKKGMICHGRVVSWRGENFWFGHQEYYPDSDPGLIEQIRQQIAATKSYTSRTASPADAESARSHLRELHSRFVARHDGNEWVQFPDGLAAVREILTVVSNGAEEKVNEQLEQWKQNKAPQGVRPIIECAGAVGLFFNPEQGPEWIPDFDKLIRGLEKKGVELDDAEVKAIFSAMSERDIGCEFIRKLADKYGAESIFATFLLPSDGPEFELEFLFRQYKAHVWHQPGSNGLLTAIRVAMKA